MHMTAIVSVICLKKIARAKKGWRALNFARFPPARQLSVVGMARAASELLQLVPLWRSLCRNWKSETLCANLATGSQSSSDLVR